ncbi:hypothetical protein M405DRAFT_55881 [Rhizopogon salebrosus TDB-379]|nr:hypothetical protein M405DRAFT_55881 [Rhizopogon salebrosus TDB-379]
MLTKRIHDGPRKYDHMTVHDTREPCRSSATPRTGASERSESVLNAVRFDSDWCMCYKSKGLNVIDHTRSASTKSS